jgi:hypothetical protein
MTHRALRFTLAAVVLSTAACADNRSTPLAPASGSALSAPLSFSYDGSNRPDGPDQARIQVMPTRSDAGQNASDFASRQQNRSSGTGIYYHGGPVLQAGTKVAAVYWASSPIYSGGPAAGTTGAGSSDGSLIGFFLRNVGGSPYYNINSTYTDGGGHAIVNSVTYTQYWANNANVPASGANVTDAQMVAMLQSGFNSGALSYDPSTLYHVFTAGKVNLGGGFGTQYCAYHAYATVTIGGASKTVLYSAMPYDYAYPSACTNGTASPNGDPGADAEINVLAHETEETTTDMFGSAWFDNRGYENADKCAWTWGSTQKAGNGGLWNITVGGKNFLVQENWVNSGSGGCVQHWP